MSSVKKFKCWSRKTKIFDPKNPHDQLDFAGKYSVKSQNWQIPISWKQLTSTETVGGKNTSEIRHENSKTVVEEFAD